MIVVVDDHEMVLKLVEKYLEKEGLSSKLFTNATDALKFLNENSDNVKLLIVDIYMPGMDGLEFASETLKLEKDIPIIMISAATYDTVLEDERLKNKVHFFRKPFSQEKLIDKVKKLL